jgi:two-component system cell cycle sensor histidine kinase/response regulator CckA
MPGRKMSRPLRILIVDDSEEDAQLVLRDLHAGYAVTSERVDEEGAMRGALSRSAWDLVISDWRMPRFSALAALAVVHAESPDLPLIIVSGTVGEEAVVAALHAGARDFVAKDKLARLVPAIERELREQDVRRARRTAEDALFASEARFARLSQSGIIGVVVLGTDGRIGEANDAFLRMIGRGRGELESGVRSVDITPFEWHAADVAAVAQVEVQGAAGPWEKEYVRAGDGTRVPVLIGMAKLDTSSNIAFVADLSARKRAEHTLRKTEEQLRQMQKMDAIGSLAGGVAHDFNNLLSIILGYSSLILGDAKLVAAHADVEEIKHAGERAADLTRQLLAFGRRQVLEPKVVDLNEVLLRMERMIRRLIGEDVELKILPAEGLDRVNVDPGQVEQVIMNLAVNARDAMPSGGTLTITTANLGQADAAMADGVSGQRVMLTVTDTGCGMDRETQGQAFEPFFTTKPVGKGTGLGLSTVFGIVKQSGGSISLVSAPGQGTTFAVYFPQMTEESTTHRSAYSPTPQLGAETILVTEDETQLRALMRTVLSRHGYRVLDAADGIDALRQAASHDGPIHLLLTDVVMPAMSGKELASRLASIRPRTRVLYMSGYTDDAIANHGVLNMGIAFIQKPFRPDALIRRVREVLDGTDPPREAGG